MLRFKKRSEKVMAGCGHETYLSGQVTVFDEGGESDFQTFTIENISKPDYCLDCLRKMIIKCPWCGDPIWPGKSIALSPIPKGFKIPKYVKTYDGQLIGCSKKQCLHGHVNGFWVLPGKIEIKSFSPQK